MTAIERLVSGVSVRPTGTAAFLIWLVGLAFMRFGVDAPEWVGVIIVMVPLGILSYIAPRWAEEHGVAFKHPAAFAAYLTALVAWLLPPIVTLVAGLFGMDVEISQLTGDEIMALSGIISALVSLVTPIEDDDLEDPALSVATFPKEHVGEGHPRLRTPALLATLKAQTDVHDKVEWPDGSRGLKYLTLTGEGGNVHALPVVPASIVGTEDDRS